MLNGSGDETYENLQRSGRHQTTEKGSQNDVVDGDNLWKDFKRGGTTGHCTVKETRRDRIHLRGQREEVTEEVWESLPRRVSKQRFEERDGRVEDTEVDSEHTSVYEASDTHIGLRERTRSAHTGRRTNCSSGLTSGS